MRQRFLPSAYRRSTVCRHPGANDADVDAVVCAGVFLSPNTREGIRSGADAIDTLWRNLRRVTCRLVAADARLRESISDDPFCK